MPLPKRCLAALCALPLLTACTDVRGRLSPDVLAVDVTEQGTLFAMHCGQQEEVITTAAHAPMELCAALEKASGKRIEAGHLSLLVLHGDPATILPDYLRARILMPTSEVLYAETIPAELPSAEQLRAAVRTGAMPARTADLILGDLVNGSGVSALPCMKDGKLTLMLCDGSGILNALSADACRGLALCGGRFSPFPLAAGEDTITVKRAKLRFSAEQTDTGLCFTLRGRIICKPEGKFAADWSARAAETFTRMLEAACRETAQSAGADLLLLREAAIHDRIREADTCTREVWRDALRRADFRIEISAVQATFG